MVKQAPAKLHGVRSTYWTAVVAALTVLGVSASACG